MSNERLTESTSLKKQLESTRTAIVYRTRAPIKLFLLKKILAFAQELRDSPQYDYDFVVMVDETVTQGSAHRIRSYFDLYANGTLAVPNVFPVSEKMILDEYPRFHSYLYNEPERNVNNETGICCQLPMMWQMFVPSFTLFMKRHNYDYAWEIEEDIDTVGNETLIQLIHKWNTAMKEEHVDLVGERTYLNMVPHENKFIRERHTQGFAKILQRMNPDLKHAPHWTSLKETPKWTCLSDGIQRHSRAMSNRLYEQISQNVYAFCECFVQPIAWSGNMTMRELSQIEETKSYVGGLEDLSLKRDREVAEESLNSTGNTTVVFHEEYYLHPWFRKHDKRDKFSF